MRVMIDFGASGRMAGVSLLALAVGLATAATVAAAKDVPGRKRCYVAGIETYKEEPVYRDKSSGYQRVQVPGSSGERCFWEPLNYQAAAAAAPVRPSRAAPAITGRHARTAEASESGSPSSSDALPKSAPASERTAAPETGPQRLAALPPQPQARPEPAPPPQPQPAPQARPEPAPPPQPQPAPQARPEPAPLQPQPAPQARPEPEPQTTPEPHRPAMPVLSPRGLSSGDSGTAQDLRIETRPVTSGGGVSTVSSGPGIDALTGTDREVPPVDEPMRLAAARNAMASLSPRTAVRGSQPQRAETPEPSPAANEAPEPAPSSAPASSRPPPAASKRGGGSFVQLGSVTSYQKAKRFWTDVTGRYPDALAGFSPNIVEADIPGKGVWYRVRVGPLEGAKAKSLCERLKRLEGTCLVVSK